MTNAIMALRPSGPLGRQWFPASTQADIRDAPASARLLGRDLVFWRSPNGAVVAAPDRCTHSKWELSKGEVHDGCLVCPKHGWTFGDAGRCVAKPSNLPISERAHLTTHPSAERYGLIWVSLDEPTAPIIDIDWDTDERFRRIFTSASVWQSNAIRIVETILSQSDSAFGDAQVDVPFFVQGTLKSQDGAAHHRLVSCTPGGGRTSVVTTVLWTTNRSEAEDAKIVEQATADLRRIKEAAEQDGGLAPAADIASNNPLAPSVTEWRSRFSDFVGQPAAQ